MAGLGCESMCVRACMGMSVCLFAICVYFKIAITCCTSKSTRKSVHSTRLCGVVQDLHIDIIWVSVGWSEPANIYFLSHDILCSVFNSYQCCIQRMWLGGANAPPLNEPLLLYGDIPFE